MPALQDDEVFKTDEVFLWARRSTSCCAFLRASRTEEVFLILGGLLMHALRHALQGD